MNSAWHLSNTPIDIVTILDICGGDPDKTRQFVDLYLKHTPRYARMLKAGLDDNDWAAVSHAAHSLRGSASMIGDHAVSRNAKVIEDACACNDGEGARMAFLALQGELDRTHAALAEHVSVL